MATYPSNMAAPRGFPASNLAMSSAPAAPAGTFLPGTKVQVGSHRVVIDKYLSEGGFAHVYVVSLPKPVDGKDKAVLKRVAVPDKDHLAEMRNEVETMKRLRGHKYIVKYIDSHASSLKNGGYEVFLLMEWCNGGGLIDFMNTRLQNRLTEPEIVKIFTDVAEGVACMHYLKPALMHRDLKVENVLISVDGKTRTFKLCDFGSAAPARPAATSAAEGRLIEDDVQRHTTLQYRSPEMIDVYRKQPIDEKSDIWALGCFLYKLCYYTTPFEEVGQMAILNASFKYPGYPRFSDELKLLIASMLQENPVRRPNIYQVLAKTCKMDGRPLPVKDEFAARSHSEDKRSTTLSPTSRPLQSSGASLAPPKPEVVQSIPSVEPMRRGRPLKPMSHHNSAKPSPSPLRMIENGDVFAGLDGGIAGDELSSKFPKLEEFSLMADRGSSFAFQPSAPNRSSVQDQHLAERVTKALADEAFAQPASPPKPQVLRTGQEETRPRQLQDGNRSSEGNSTRNPTDIVQPAQSSRMVSKAVGSSPPLQPTPKPFIASKPIWKVPDKVEEPRRSSSISQTSIRSKPAISKDKSGSRLASLLQQDASRSQSSQENETTLPTSSRPSLEGGRPLPRELESSVQRSKSLAARNRPVSVHIGSHPTHINDTDIRHAQSHLTEFEAELPKLEHAVSDTSQTNITSDIEFLKAREEEEKEKHKHMKRLSGGSRHQKRSSLPSAALAGTKNILQGRFGEAFRKFESHGDDNEQEEPPDSPHPNDRPLLSPIAGSEATDLSDDRRALDETEELSPELRRELEKQKLEAEERRVERAAAEYKQNRSARPGGPPPISSKAVSIQNRVQSLLKENDRPATKSATGYGRFTQQVDTASPISSSAVSSDTNLQKAPKSASAPTSSVNLQSQVRSQRPTAPPKPRTLRTGVTEVVSPQQSTGLQDDWEENFSQKYPDLSQIEVVETSISGTGRPQSMRMKEV